MTAQVSPAQILAAMPAAERQRYITSLPRETRAALLYNWKFWARPNQLAPKGEWFIWLIMTGRGWGKTRSGSEWVREQVKKGVGRVALVGETAADARDVMVEGETGILRCSWRFDKDVFGRNIGIPNYEPSKRRLTWANGATATTYSGDDPEQLRGPQQGAALVDELAKMKNPDETWQNLVMGTRLGRHPQIMVTTTPRPKKIMRKLIDARNSVVTTGSTFENISNLAQNFIDEMKDTYSGTRIGRQELEGALLEDFVGALWTTEMFQYVDQYSLDEFVRINVSIDPSGAKDAKSDSDEIGITVQGKRRDNTFCILADRSVKGGPNTWASAAIQAYHFYSADRIVAETNYGGAMVESTIRNVDPIVSVRCVTASRGKIARAEPIAALYEQKRVDHVRGLSNVESQMLATTGVGYEGDGSPDRMDAVVWGVTDLMKTNTIKFHGIA